MGIETVQPVLPINRYGSRLTQTKQLSIHSVTVLYLENLYLTFLIPWCSQLLLLDKSHQNLNPTNY